MRELYRALLIYVLLAGTLAAALCIGLRLRYRLRVRRAREATTEPAIARPDYGADEKFGRELCDLRDAEVCPELVSEIETELRWGQTWHDFEQALHAEVERIFSPAIDALNAPRTFAELRSLLDLPAGELVLT